MKALTKRYKRLRVSVMKTAFFVAVMNIITVPVFTTYKTDGDNLFKVFLNGTEVGIVGKNVDLEEVLCDTRRALCDENDGLILADAELTTEGSEVVFAKTDSEEDVKARMLEVLNGSIYDTLQHAYTVKIGSAIYNLSGSDDVCKVLQAAVDVYDTDNEYTVSLERDSTRELSALTAVVVPREEKIEEEKKEEEAPVTAGFESIVDSVDELVSSHNTSDDFDSYDYGVLEMAFGTSIEIADAYLTREQIMNVDDVIAEVTSAQEKNTIYEVQSGDTLSGISMSTNIPMEKIIALNDAIENESSMIKVGQEIIITSPEPPLTIERKEQVYLEEYYDADVVYIDNDDWYTNQEVTLQEPSAGRRNIVALVNYRNEKEVDREVVKEELVLEAVPKIVEKGTKIPPNYIKPLSGGRLSSPFGRRKAPTRGASTYHQGVDWAVAKGTTVVASSGGRVTRAGWAKGYGYCVFIQHPDGRETRYGHLSKTLVSPGQSVRQGEKIALSGNSGVSSGPHLHFEIRINGTPVNPLKYLN